VKRETEKIENWTKKTKERVRVAKEKARAKGGLTLFYAVAVLKVHKIENFFGFDFEICTFS
jgi:hypothetical protein